MTDNTPENLRKFLKSDDPAMVRMGISMAEGLDKYAVEAGDDPDDFYVSLKRLSPTDCLEMNETLERIQAQARGDMVQVEDKITGEIYITYRPIVAGGDVES